jgi:hypothetical protein
VDQRLDPANSVPFTLEKIRDEQDGFLIPERNIETEEDAKRWVYRRWGIFFEHFLQEWWLDTAGWPQKPTLKMFKQWFDIQFSPMVWDLGNDPIDHEYWG